MDLATSFQNIPLELRNSSRWCLWRLEDTVTPEGKERPRCKDPKQSKSPIHNAKSNDPSTWSSLDEALAALPQLQPFPKYEAEPNNRGLGLVIGPPFIAVDIDKVRDPETEETEPWAVELIKRYPPTYTELSPSGRGFHLWFRGKAPEQFKNGKRGSDLEVYPGGRYFTMTGTVIEGSVSECAQLTDAEVVRLLGEVERREQAKKNADKQLKSARLQELMASIDFPDLSAAVQSLLTQLCYAHDCDREKVVAEFKKSALYQQTHWQTKWERLGETSLNRAVEFAKANPRRQKDELDPACWPQEFPALCDWPELPKPAPIVDRFLLRDCIHVFAGLFESYKTIAALEICASIRENRKAFDHFDVRAQHEILYLCPDMSPALFLEYASQFGLHRDQGFRVMRHDADVLHAVDSPVLQAAVDGRILVLDTMLDYANIRESFQSQEWVGFFSKLRRLIRHCGCVAVVLVAHPTKAGARNTVIDATEYLKDSVTFGGKIDVGYAFRKIDGTSQVQIERIKGRGFSESIRFAITKNDEQGNSWLSRGRFPVCDPPEGCKPLSEKLSAKKAGRTSTRTEERLQQIHALLSQGKSQRAIAKSLGVSQTQVSRWLKAEESTEEIPF